MRIRKSCPRQPLRSCRVEDVQRAIVHVQIVVRRRTGVVRVRVLRVQRIKRAALEIREQSFKSTRAVALGRQEHPVRQQRRILFVVMRLYLRKCGKIWNKVDFRWKRGRGGHGSEAEACTIRNRDALAAAACEPALQLRNAQLELRNHGRFVEELVDVHGREDVLLEEEEARCRPASQQQEPKGAQRPRRCHVAGKADSEGLEHALSTQVVRNI